MEQKYTGGGTCFTFDKSTTYSESAVNIKPRMPTQVLIDTRDRYWRWDPARAAGYKAEYCVRLRESVSLGFVYVYECLVPNTVKPSL
jgi:hypothetical protein